MIIDTDTLPEGYSLAGCVEYIFESQTLFILVSDKELVFLIKSWSRIPGQVDEPDGNRPDRKFQSVGYQEFQISDALLKSRVLDLLRHL